MFPPDDKSEGARGRGGEGAQATDPDRSHPAPGTRHTAPAATDVPRESPRTILFQFVVFPLIVVAVGVGVFLLFGAIASEEHSIPEYLNAIQSGSSHRRWQAAYQLSKSLKRGEAKKYPDLAVQVSNLYAKSKDDDPRIRQYLGMVLGNLGDRRATAVLVDGLNDPHVETRVFALWALAELRDPGAVPRIVELTRDGERDVRKTAVYALGKIGDRSALPALEEALKDSAHDVRWNAALSLAQFGDPRAIGVLREMLDRGRLDRVEGLRPDQEEILMINAISAYSSLVGAEARPELEKIAATDPNLRVRATARDALQRMGGGAEGRSGGR